MKQSDDADWISVLVATTLPLLAALTSPWVSLPITLLALLAMSVYYARRSRSRVGPAACLLGAAVIAASMVYLWMRGHR